ncbi:UDP-2,3-diacylglucosamine diphosphatase [Hydrogenimonas cancrithermarum]|uniref:UDP-2,3-diacylglucosamine hydrolase n=1 Tax=Hydrogenimonas cancrithermarum TaxID=2993563 RepID=A0ABN6WWN8_9BACT|nr:metallophosphoesterase [Hydrogenimonas cancrithermarum]BDY13595.1 UDP-2,3-diacylglucosamine hydrolase [Hydrogenimonas cancrithermarum]
MRSGKRGFGAEVRLKEGAWFIADAHYAHYNPALYRFLSSIEASDLPPQMILMGDIFDLLFADAPNSIEPNLKMVDLLKRISESCEVIYLEGNHDFGLEKLFGETMRVVKRADQPLMASFGPQRVALHHGDLLQGVMYEIYTALIRNPSIDRLLNRIDTLKAGAIIGWLENYNRKKEPCYRIEGFETRMRQRLDLLMKRYDFDIWVEGHYHQDMGFEHRGRRYRNLPAFACDQSWVVVKSSPNGIDFEEKKVRNVV